MNPHNSPWNKPKPFYIQDPLLRSRWTSIKQYLSTTPNVIERYDYLKINDICFIAKNSTKMRIKSHLDWCYYTPKTLAQAIDANSIESYYEIMLKDAHSDPNVWKDSDFEMELKTRYAIRADRALSIVLDKLKNNTA
jgi:hypothetical protein